MADASLCGMDAWLWSCGVGRVEWSKSGVPRAYLTPKCSFFYDSLCLSKQGCWPVPTGTDCASASLSLCAVQYYLTFLTKEKRSLNRASCSARSAHGARRPLKIPESGPRGHRHFCQRCIICPQDDPHGCID